jgi:hypothetical protein
MTRQEVEDGENVFHYLDPTAAEVIIGKVAVLVNMVCSTIVFTYLLGKSVAGIIFPRAGDEMACVGIAGTVVSAVAIAMNSISDVAFELFYGIGDVAFSIVGFVLPAVYFFAQMGVGHVRWTIVAFVVLGIGSAMMVISFVVTVQGAIAG